MSLLLEGVNVPPGAISTFIRLTMLSSLFLEPARMSLLLTAMTATRTLTSKSGAMTKIVTLSTSRSPLMG